MADIGPGSIVAVLGAGLMGAAIAAQYADAGFAVRITTSSSTSGDEAVNRVRKHLSRDGGDISWCESVEQAASGASLVVESLPEDVKFKQEQLRQAQNASPSAVLCSNTSSLLIGDIAAGLQDPTALVGTHYLNPPAAFPVVELVAGPQTNAGYYVTVERVLRGMGQAPIRVRKDTAGFVINRLQFALLREAVALVDEGIASAEDLDIVMRDGLARRWSHAGPFTVVAMGGPELFDRVAAQVWPHLSTATEPVHGVSRRSFPTEELEQIRRRVRSELLNISRN